MPVTVVVGAQWGDEGKAKIIDLLSKEHTYVVRYQGGHNAGHTVVVNGERYALQLVPSGVLYDHVVPVIGNGVVVDLPTLFSEIDTLEARGVSCTRLRVSSRAHLIFPWHQAHDAIAEAMRGDDKIGTTLKGIGPAYADKARRVGVRVGEVADLDHFVDTVRARAIAENALIEQAGGAPLDVDDVVERFAAYGARLRPHVTDTVTLLHDALGRGEQVLLEGAQATFLDLDHGTYPYVTSSNPTAGGACVGSGLGPRDIDRIVGITKAYTTRVGAGPFPTELLDADGDTLIDVGREFGTVTGRRRRAGWLDCVMLRQAVRLNSLTELALTKLDVLDGFETVRVCTAYRLDGRPIESYPDRSEILARVEPVYETMPGWQVDLSLTRERSELPAPARDFLGLVEAQVGVPVNVVGVGAERDDYLLWGGHRVIPRYSTPEMSAVWSDVSKFGRFLEVELLATEAHAAIGIVPEADALACRERSPTADEGFVRAILDREAITDHDVAAFVDVVQAAVGGEAGKWIHYGLTSSDVGDTALCWQMTDAVDLLVAESGELLRTLVDLAREHRDTVMIGRTHGVHAEPTTFGAKVALWAMQVDRDRTRLRAARDTVSVMKLSGAVGTYSNIPPSVERFVGDALGLRPVASTQVIARDRHAEYLYACASIGATCELMAVELRHLQRTEVREVQEGFKAGQKGSSAMPHKRNPISAETISGLARVLRSNLLAGLQDIALWHERDISHSSVERIVLPDSSHLAHYVLRRSNRLLSGLMVFPERMRANLDASHGLVFSQPVLLGLVASGMSREDAYRVVQSNAMRAWDEGLDFRSLLEEDPAVDDAMLDAAFDLDRSLRELDTVFEQLDAIES